MNKHQQKVLLATLCGVVITVAAALAVQPTMASNHAPATIWTTSLV